MNKIYDLSNLTLEERMQLYGPYDQNLNTLENIFQVEILEEDDYLFTNDEVDLTALQRAIDTIVEKMKKDGSIKTSDVHFIAEDCKNNPEKERVVLNSFGRRYDHQLIYPKTKNQQLLMEMLDNKNMTFILGPAGTGKTFLSVVYAVNQLRANKVKKIILTRPVVEAGESLGFLPGDLEEKIDPYLRPIYDSLDELISPVNRMNLIEKGVIEIAPLAYMRGRTLDDAVIILDEAQNTTIMQMKMFLTRMGFHSKVIINGDYTQVDLTNHKLSGLIDAMHRLKDIDEIGFMYLTANDVVRHPLVKKILESYQND